MMKQYDSEYVEQLENEVRSWRLYGVCLTLEEKQAVWLREEEEAEKQEEEDERRERERMERAWEELGI